MAFLTLLLRKSQKGNMVYLFIEFGGRVNVIIVKSLTIPLCLPSFSVPDLTQPKGNVKFHFFRHYF